MLLPLRLTGCQTVNELLDSMQEALDLMEFQPRNDALDSKLCESGIPDRKSAKPPQVSRSFNDRGEHPIGKTFLKKSLPVAVNLQPEILKRKKRRLKFIFI